MVFEVSLSKGSSDISSNEEPRSSSVTGATVIAASAVVGGSLVPSPPVSAPKDSVIGSIAAPATVAGQLLVSLPPVPAPGAEAVVPSGTQNRVHFADSPLGRTNGWC